MSANYKKNQKEKRLKLKRNKKAAMKAQYAAWRDSGENSKRSRIEKSKAAKPIRKFRQRKRSKRMSPIPGLTQKQYRNTLSLKQLMRHV